MPLTAPLRRRFLPLPPRRPLAEPRPAPPGRWRLGVFLLVAVGLLFCHPCHRDVDDELAAPPCGHDAPEARTTRSTPSLLWSHHAGADPR
jgi:hypothetical protein